MAVAPFIVIATMMTFAVAAYACTYYVGLLRVWGDNNGINPAAFGAASATGTVISGSEVIVTGSDKWGTDANGPMTQAVSTRTAQAHAYSPGGAYYGCTSTVGQGCFFIKAESGGTQASFNETTTDIWYDVNTVPIGYTSHTTWGGDPTYDCMSWNLGAIYGVQNAGSVLIGKKGGTQWSLITSATNGTLGTGSAINVTAGNVAGPFYVQSKETSGNTSPKESAICLTDSTSTNGTQAPLFLLGGGGGGGYYALEGCRWAVPVITYSVQTPAAYTTAVQNGASRWNGFGNLSLNLVPAGADITVQAGYYATAWDGLTTYRCDASGHFVPQSMTIYLNTRYASGYNLEGQSQVLVHEFGHALGLAHYSTPLCSDVQIMYPTSDRYFTCGISTPQLGDSSGARALYP